MDRNIDAATKAALDAKVKRPLILVELDFASGFVRVHSGVGDFVWGDKTFKGVGQFGKIIEIEETEAVQANPLRMELSGVSPEIVSISLGENYRGRPGRIWIAYLDEDYKAIGQPIGPFIGKMDTMDGEIGKTGAITLSMENRVAEWERARIRRYTHADQQAEYPDDFGLEFVSAVAQMELLWGTS